MPYYIGIDIGTGSTKALAINLSTDQILYTAQVPYPILQPKPHYNEQDPELLWQAFVTSLHVIISFMKEKPEGIGISSAMHSIIAVDYQHQPLTNVITWADARSTAEAEMILASRAAKNLYTHTGTPIHAMSPLSKILWIRKSIPRVFSNTYKFISIKEYIWFKLFGSYQVDYSVASATGLFDILKLQWYKPALKVAGISALHLSQPVSTTLVRSDVLPAITQQFPFLEGVKFVIGASDGCLANLGSHAVTPGIASLTIGTSGAIRVASKKPCYNFKRMTFNYRLDERTFICGGPTNNGGVIWKWFIMNFIKDDPSTIDYAKTLERMREIPPGAERLIFLPYLLGERAPIWNSKACGVFFGINMYHTQAHFIRAVVEGISFALFSISKALEEASGTIKYIYASGGFTLSQEWLQIIADIFNKKVYRQNTEDASAIGAALLAIKAIEHRTSYPMFHNHDDAQEIIPDRQRHKQYARLYPTFIRLYGKLKEEMDTLFELK